MNRKFGEIDFIIQNNRNAVPLEIKSGTDYKKQFDEVYKTLVK